MSLRVDLRSRWQEFLDVQCWSGIITLHSLYIMVVNGGGLSHCYFNGPTSRNVAGIYCLSDVNCNLLFWVYTLPPVSRSWACRTAWQGHNIWFWSSGLFYPLLRVWATLVDRLVPSNQELQEIRVSFHLGVRFDN